MNEKKLISSIRQLKEIKPRKEWVVLAKQQILNIEQKKAWNWNVLDYLPSLIYQRKLAYAFACLLFIVVGVFGFAQYTVPGDLLFSVKKLSEQSQTVFTQDQLKYNFEIANKRLQDLTQVVKENRTGNIAAAVNEFKASMADATKNLVENISQNKTQKVPYSLKEIAAEVKKIQDNQKQAETLGIDISQTSEVKELENALADLVQSAIIDLKETTLTGEQQIKLERVKELYDEGKFSEALEEMLMINN